MVAWRRQKVLPKVVVVTDDKPFAPGSRGQDRTHPAWLHNGWSRTEENITNIILEG